MKFGFKYIAHKTPNILYRIGIALLGVGLISPVLIPHNNAVREILMWASMAGTFLTCMFAEKESKTKK